MPSNRSQAKVAGRNLVLDLQLGMVRLGGQLLLEKITHCADPLAFPTVHSVSKLRDINGLLEI